jgi:hypothetical protein
MAPTVDVVSADAVVVEELTDDVPVMEAGHLSSHTNEVISLIK